MAFDRALVEWAVEAMEPLGPVSMRQMMGTGTLYWEGRIFAVVDEEAIWFKSDAVSNAIWDEAGCERFTFTEKSGETVAMNYRRAPADCYDDADALRELAGVAIAATQRAPAKKPKKKRPG